MRELSASEILGVWERGRSGTLPERALQLLAAGGQPDQPDLLSVGKRDALLVELRQLMFGPSLEATVTCPHCAEVCEVALAADNLRGERPAAADWSLEVEADGRRLRFRLPTAADLVAVSVSADVEEGRAILLERCVIGNQLTPGSEDAISTRMAEADPGAWIELALACPACEHGWSAPFDIVAFLWAEVDACARRFLREVHALASAYGWCESDVLALSAERRAAYMELAAG